MDDLKLNTEVEITKKAYKKLSKEYSWAVARREDEGKYFIMLYYAGHGARKGVKQIINRFPVL